MASLAGQGYYCISVDLKGYGQSEKAAGDYRHEGVAAQLYAMLLQAPPHGPGLGRLRPFNIVTHDRGTVQADYIVAKHPDAVLRYGRGEQHLYHFHPSLAPQREFFREAPYSGLFMDPVKFVTFTYTWITEKDVSDEVIGRVIQEWAFGEGTDLTSAKAVPRYFNASSFRQEWLQRRGGKGIGVGCVGGVIDMNTASKASEVPGEEVGLLERWKCPVMIMQGKQSKTQPREFYEEARTYIPNAKDVKVRFIEGGHYWPAESPEETTRVIEEMLRMPVK